VSNSNYDAPKMRTFVINLPRATDRRASIQAQLDASELDYELVEAVEGRALSAEERARLVDKTAVERFPDWLTPGAIGCALSHRRALELAAATGEVSLVLEDDAILSPGLEELCAELPAPPDGVVLLNFRSFKPCEIAPTGTPGLFAPVDPRQPVSSLAYLVGHDSARRMAELILPVRFAADSWGEYVAGGAIGELLLAYPRPVMPAPEVTSTILRAGGRGWRDHWPARQLRMLNRRGIAWRMNRVRVVDHQAR
jgi:glycosyl transferase family 25